MHTPYYLQNKIHLGQRMVLDPLMKTLDRLGNPQKKIKAILVGGTNGKGSITKFLGSILNNSSKTSYHIGFFNSPSVFDFHDMIYTNKLSLSEQVAESLAEEIFDLSTEPLTLFEIAVTLSCLWFNKQNIDLAIIEVGMGGRYDATNVFSPILSIISNISEDHLEVLGGTLESIVQHKIGISRKNIPLFTSTRGHALTLLSKYAEKEEISINLVRGNSCYYENEKRNQTGKDSLSAVINILNIEVPSKLGLLGRHQIQNAAIAIAVANYLDKNGFPLNKNKYNKALEITKLYGRSEILYTNQNHKTIILDVAHNPDGINAITDFVNDFNINNENIAVIISLFADKDVDRMLEIMHSKFFHLKTMVCTQTNRERSLSSDILFEKASKIFNKEIEILNLKSIRDAIVWLENSTIELFLITGSLSVIEEVYKSLNKERCLHQ